MGMRARNKKLFAEIESAYNTEATVAADDAIKTSGLSITRYAGERVSQAYDRPGMGNDRQINVNEHAGLGEFMVPMVGSGDWETAPAWGKLLRACAMAQTDNTAADDTGTATAGTSTTLTDSGATWTVDEYAGFAVVITAGTGVGQARRVTANTATELTVTPAWATTPDATSEYSITLGTFDYTPVDSGFESLTCIVTEELVQQKMVGVRGNWGIRANPGELPVFMFSNFLGSYNRPVALALTDPDDSAFGDAIPVTYSNTTVLTIAGVQHPVGGFTLDGGNTITRLNQPGRQETMVEDRRPSGTIIVSPATADAIIALLGSIETHDGATDVAIAMTHGDTPGGIIKVAIPAASFGEVSDQVIGGETYFSLPFNILTPDSGAALTVSQAAAA
ncbi:MAG: hypothetical protein M0R02_12495 [Bacteroidales bacterium]|nr:hypothetical protein [Bacteroidales bacterium]